MNGRTEKAPTTIARELERHSREDSTNKDGTEDTVEKQQHNIRRGSARRRMLRG
jgi:hypothetical protein